MGGVCLDVSLCSTRMLICGAVTLPHLAISFSQRTGARSFWGGRLSKYAFPLLVSLVEAILIVIPGRPYWLFDRFGGGSFNLFFRSFVTLAGITYSSRQY
jgi:hypothetical protein